MNKELNVLYNAMYKEIEDYISSIYTCIEEETGSGMFDRKRFNLYLLDKLMATCNATKIVFAKYNLEELLTSISKFIEVNKESLSLTTYNTNKEIEGTTLTYVRAIIGNL